MSGGKALEPILQNIIVLLGANVNGLKGVTLRVNLGLVYKTPVGCQSTLLMRQRPTNRLMRSGRGFPIAFFKAPVIVKAAPILRPSPSIPQFSSHNLSLNLYLPESRLRPVRLAGMAAWCENRPSMTMVYMPMMTAGARTT